MRPKGMLPLPLPVRGGSIEKLRDFINVKADEDFILVVAWLLSAMRDHGPYPVLTVIGEQGRQKARLLRFCVRSSIRISPLSDHRRATIGTYSSRPVTPTSSLTTT